MQSGIHRTLPWLMPNWFYIGLRPMIHISYVVNTQLQKMHTNLWITQIYINRWCSICPIWTLIRQFNLYFTSSKWITGLEKNGHLIISSFTIQAHLKFAHRLIKRKIWVDLKMSAFTKSDVLQKARRTFTLFLQHSTRLWRVITVGGNMWIEQWTKTESHSVSLSLSIQIKMIS